jgi:mevalonate kinase
MRNYSSKLLLFGEHVLLLGSTALAMPVPAYSGKWVTTGAQPDDVLQQKIFEFATSDQLRNACALDIKAFQKDLNRGLVFKSTIPIGYGLGSSGALCAAVYNRYCRNKSDDLLELKIAFATMESFFHGESSGIDPLTSYLKKPLIIRNRNNVTSASLPDWQESPIVFLIDSGLPRQTGHLVQWFMEKSKTEPLAAALQHQYLPSNEALVHHWLTANTEQFWHHLNLVSQFQLDYFEPMVPATMRTLWTENLQSGEITFKICGAGGGGFLLGFSKTMAPVLALSKRYNLIFPFSGKP